MRPAWIDGAIIMSSSTAKHRPTAAAWYVCYQAPTNSPAPPADPQTYWFCGLPVDASAYAAVVAERDELRRKLAELQAPPAQR